MKRLTIAAAVVLLCATALPVASQWVRDDLTCVRETGETFETGYISRSYATAVCNALNRFEVWIGTAEALSIRKSLVRNADGTYSTAFPDGDKASTPEPPTLGQVQAVGSDTLRIQRTQDASGGTEPYTYKLERTLASNPAAFVEIVADADLFADGPYDDTGLVAETSYLYRIRVTDSAGSPLTSGYSLVVQGTTNAAAGDTEDPTAPGNADVTNITSSGATCTWTAAIDNVGVVRYDVYYGTGNGSGVVLESLGLYGSVSGGALSIDLSNLDPEQEYYCRPTAVDAAGNAESAVLRTFFDTLEEEEPPSGNIIFKDNFNNRTVGTAYTGVSGIWNTGSSNPNGQCSWRNTSPPVSGSGTYLRCGPVVKDGANVFRSEYKYIGQGTFSKPVAPTDLGNGHNVSPIYWYGFKFCLDQYTTGSGPHGGFHLTQFHDVDLAPHSPKISVLANAQSLRVYIEHNMEAPPANPGGFEGASFTTAPLYTAHYQQCIDVIEQVRWDTRVSVASACVPTAGSTGLYRLWLGSSSTPVFEWVNKATQHKVGGYAGCAQHAFGDFGVPYKPLGGYLSCWRTNCVPEGTVYEARYENFTVMDSTGSVAAMRAAINAAN